MGLARDVVMISVVSVSEPLWGDREKTMELGTTTRPAAAKGRTFPVDCREKDKKDDPKREGTLESSAICLVLACPILSYCISLSH